LEWWALLVHTRWVHNQWI